MRGKTAKKLRLMAYSLGRHKDEHEANDPRFREYQKTTEGMRVNTGQRKLYLKLKAEYRRWVRDGRKPKDDE